MAFCYYNKTPQGMNSKLKSKLFSKISQRERICFKNDFDAVGCQLNHINCWPFWRIGVKKGSTQRLNAFLHKKIMAKASY